MRFDCTIMIESSDSETGMTRLNEFAFSAHAYNGTELQFILVGFKHQAMYETLLYPEGKPAHVTLKLKTINAAPSRFQ